MFFSFTSYRVISNNENPHIFVDIVSSNKELNKEYLNVVKVFSISTGIGVAKEILISLRSQQKLPEVTGSDHLNMIFNKLIENVEQMKVKNQKQIDIRNIFRS